ncbi:MAG: VWA domain-containing protein [Bacteroidota bacterium]
MRTSFLLGLLSLAFLFCSAQDKQFYAYKHLKASSLEELSLSSQARWGSGLASLGDLNGDGLVEVAVSQPYSSEPAITILSLDKEGAVKSYQSWQPAEGLTAGGRFGLRLQALGDWDGDGVADLAAGEPFAKDGVLMYGAVHLLLLHPNGQLKKHIRIGGRSPGMVGKLSRNLYFGTDIAVVGDLDGNGVNDLAVGAPGDPAKQVGEVFFLLMKSPDEVKEVMRLTEVMGELTEALSVGDNLGSAVESLGNLDGSGQPQLAVGASLDDTGGFQQGSFWLLTWSRELGMFSGKKHVLQEGAYQARLKPSDRLGYSLAYLPPLDSENKNPQLVVGALNDDEGGKDQGSLHILRFDKEGEMVSGQKIAETSIFFEGDLQPKYQWPLSVSPLGDLNQDGRLDILVQGGKEGLQQKGSIWMLFPTDIPERLKQKGVWAKGAGQLSKADSTMLYKGALTAEDSARIDSMYDLSGYAPNNLVFLLDVSASMKKPLRLPLLQKALVDLLPFMRPEDKISVITYSGKPTIQLSGIPASEQSEITSTVEGLKSQGDTKPARALKLAYETAQLHFIPKGNNRIIFATDGGFDQEELDKVFRKYAGGPVNLSVFYFGKLPPRILKEMEQLAYQGGGRSSHIVPGTAQAALLRELKFIRKKD